MLRFVRELIALRRRHRSLRRKRFLTGCVQPGRNDPDIIWHGERLEAPLWHDPNARLLAFTLSGLTADEPSLHVILNMSHESRTLAVPTLERLTWRRALDTALASPEDIRPYDNQAVAAEGFYAAQPRSVVVLEAH
jgi:glycogen operon protein